MSTTLILNVKQPKFKTMTKYMLSLVVATMLTALCGVSCAAIASCVQWNACDSVCESYENNIPIDGMCFNVDSVVEEFEADENLFIMYTDPDAGLEECPIKVDSYTYTEIIYAIKHAQKLDGRLVESKVPGVYTYVSEWEYENGVGY